MKSGFVAFHISLLILGTSFGQEKISGEQHFGQNMLRNALMVREQLNISNSRNQPLALLKDERVIKELKVSPKQQKEISKLSDQHQIQGLMKKYGLKSSNFGKLDLADALEAADGFNKAAADMADLEDAELSRILNATQMKRLKQIYIQSVLNSNERQLLRGKLALGIKIDVEAVQKILEGLKDDDARLIAEMKIRRYQLSSDRLKHVLGTRRSEELLGIPFIVDLPPDNTRPEGINRRRASVTEIRDQGSEPE